MLPPGQEAVQCKTAVFVEEVVVVGHPVSQGYKNSPPPPDLFFPEGRHMTVAENNGIKPFTILFYGKTMYHLAQPVHGVTKPILAQFRAEPGNPPQPSQRDNPLQPVGKGTP